MNNGEAIAAVTLAALLAGEQQERSAPPEKGRIFHAQTPSGVGPHLDYLLPKMPPVDVSVEVPTGDTWFEGATAALAATTEPDKGTHGTGPHLESQSNDVTVYATGLRMTMTLGTVQPVTEPAPVVFPSV